MRKVLGLLLALTVMVSMTVPTFGQQQDDKKTEKTETAKKGDKKGDKKGKKGDKKGDKKDEKKADDTKK